MDGVIVDSEPLNAKTERMTCRDYHIKIPLAEWEKFKGITEKDMWDYIVRNFTDGSIAVSTLLDHRINLYLDTAPKKIKLIPGALAFIKRAKAGIGKLACTTSQVQKIQQMVFDKFNLYRYFEAIVTADEIEKGKPDPEPYLKTITKLGMPVKYCLVIEDSINGILSAKAAGCITVGITTSFPKERLVEAGADYVVNTFEELYNLFKM